MREIESSRGHERPTDLLRALLVGSLQLLVRVLGRGLRLVAAEPTNGDEEWVSDPSRRRACRSGALTSTSQRRCTGRSRGMQHRC